MLICFIPMLFIFSLNSFCQLSPGKLSKSHSKLEGITNCTQCHLIGDKVSNQKCLTCHKDLNLQITKNKGFHSSPQNKNKECIECHSEHHGLNFEMVRFDKKTFNHNRAIMRKSHITSYIGVGGLTGVRPVHRSAEISLYVESSLHRELPAGIAKSIIKTISAFAFEDLGLNRIFGETFYTNTVEILNLEEFKIIKYGST